MKQRHLRKSVVVALPLLLAASLHAAGPTNLRCEYRENPLGLNLDNYLAEETQWNRA